MTNLEAGQVERLERYEKCLKEYTAIIRKLRKEVTFTSKANARKRRALKYLRNRYELTKEERVKLVDAINQLVMERNQAIGLGLIK